MTKVAQEIAQRYDVIKQLYNGGSLELAAQAARGALEQFPDDARLWEMLGIALHAARDFPQAMDALETATLLAPLSPAAQVALAGCYFITGRHDVARTMYRSLVEQKRRISTHLLPRVASGLFRLGESHLALEVHRERAYREPFDGDAVFAVAHFMSLVGYPAELVLPMAHRAYQLAPERIRNRVALALLHCRCGNRATAYRLLTQVPVERLVDKCCLRRLRAMAGLFEALGDTARFEACQKRLSASEGFR